MQKIIEQKLSGDQETAKKEAKYTWEKGEIAWLFDHIYRDIFKVEFTGEHWLIGNKWSRSKIYEYKYLESSGYHDLKTKGFDNDGISHDNEKVFYTTKEEALKRDYDYINKVEQECIDKCKEDRLRLSVYHNTCDFIV
jgi:hypothetical protein